MGAVIALVLGAVMLWGATANLSWRTESVCVDGGGGQTRDGWDGEKCRRFEQRQRAPDPTLAVLAGVPGAIFLVGGLATLLRR